MYLIGAMLDWQLRGLEFDLRDTLIVGSDGPLPCKNILRKLQERGRT